MHHDLDQRRTDHKSPAMNFESAYPPGSEAESPATALEPITVVRALDEHAIVAVTDRKGRILEVNDRFCSISGYTRKQLLGQDHRILNSGRHPRRYMRDMWRMILRGEVWHGEFCNRARDGRLYWVQTSIVPVQGADGQIERFVSIRTEITAQKQAEAALAESEQRFRRLFEQSGDALLLLDVETQRFVEANRSAAKMLGYAEPVAMRDLAPAALSPPMQEDGEPSAAKATRMIAAALEHGTHRFEWLHCSQRRSAFPVEVLLTAITLGRRQLLFVTWRDISEQRADAAFTTASTASLDRLARGASLQTCLEPLLAFACARHPELGLAVLRRPRWQSSLQLAGSLALSTDTERQLRQLVEGKVACCSLIEQAPCASDCPQRRCRQHFDDLRRRGLLQLQGLDADPSTASAVLLCEAACASALPSANDPFQLRWLDLMRLIISQTALREEQALSMSVFRHGGEGVMVSNAEGRALLANPAMAQMLGASSADLEGLPVSSVLGDEALLQPISTQESPRPPRDLRGRRVDGRPVIWRCVRTRLPTDGNGETLDLWMIGDVTAEREQQQRIELLAYNDPLTGLPNRSLLQERLSQAVDKADAEAGGLALLYIDLDRFKEVNDGCGHAVGDRVLQSLGRRMAGSLKPSETLARMGGDEFMLLMPDAGPEDALRRARELVDLLRQPLRLAGRNFSLGASCGISLYPLDALDVTNLMKHADIAMYEAKSVRGEACVYSRELGRALDRRLLLAERLKSALREGRLQLFYQPQVRLRDGALVGAEALLRWQEPDLGWVSPAEFVEVAERAGLMVELGAWVLQSAFSQWQAWAAAGLRLPSRISLNISALQLADPGFETRLETLRGQYTLDCASVELELTESSLIADPETAIALFERLVALGYTLAIDDFGTGYSSLSYLKRLPVTRLKIDRSFVRDMLEDASDRAIVDTILAMAKALKLETVAEGAECEATLRKLAELGCETAQGFAYSPALAPAAFRQRWLETAPG